MKISREPDACGIDCESGKGRSFVLNVFKRRLSIGKKKKKMLDEAESAICGMMDGCGHFYFMPPRIKFFFSPQSWRVFFFVFVDIKCLESMSERK